jgi:type VI protein secretion system component Hcp
MPIYMNYAGIAGEGQKPPGLAGKWIELNSFQCGVARGISSATGGASDRESSEPSVSEVVVTKASDVPTPSLFNAAYGGGKLDVSIVIATVGPGGLPGPRHTLKLRNAVITDIKPYYPQHPGRGKLTRYEKLTLTFSEYYFNGAPNVPPQLISLMTGFARLPR